MNLNELFFFKVFPCCKTSSNKLIPDSHKEKNCYFYHTTIIFENGVKKEVDKDRRREIISFTDKIKQSMEGSRIIMSDIFNKSQANLNNLQ